MTIKYTKELVESALVKADAAALKAAEEFREAHPDDFGTCGSAVVVGLSGRKRTLVKILKELGRLGQKWSGSYGYGIECRIVLPGYSQQNIGYPEAFRSAFLEVLEKELGLELHLHTWVD